MHGGGPYPTFPSNEDFIFWLKFYEDGAGVFGGLIFLLFIPDDEWTFPAGEPGETTRPSFDPETGGLQDHANCFIRRGDFINDGSPRTDFLAHEIGHGLGLAHVPGSGNLMCQNMGCISMDLGYSKDSYECVYSQEVLTACKDQDGGASGLVSVDISDSTGVNIVQIRLEDWSDSDSILLKTSSTGYDNYEEIGLESLVDYVATFSTPADLDNKYLAITCLDDGVVDDVFLHYNSNYQNMRDYVSMRQSNIEHIENSYWDEVAQGVREIPLVTDPVPDSEYLIITSDPFIEEAAPLADMWEQQGLDVVLVEFDFEENEQSDVESLIEDQFDSGILKSVLIIGLGYGRVPTYLIDDPHVTMHYLNDNYYVDFNSDFIADVPIGRIPSADENDLIWYVFKVLDYMDILSSSKLLPDRYNKHVSIGVLNAEPCGEISDTGEQVLANANSTSEIMSRYTSGQVDLFTTEDDRYWSSGCIPEEYSYSMSNGIVSQYNHDPYLFSLVSEHQHNYLLGNVVPGISWWRENASSGDVRKFIINTTCFGGGFWARDEIRNGDSIAVIGASTFMPYIVENQMFPVLMETLYSSLHVNPINRPNIGDLLLQTSEAMSEESMLARKYLFACEILGDPMLKLYNVDNSVGVEEPATLINFVQYKGNSLVFGRQNVSEQCVVKCEIYDIRGRRVYSKKVNLSGSNGQFELWNSVDSDSGRPVGSGVYLYRVIANDETFTGKMSIVR